MAAWYRSVPGYNIHTEPRYEPSNIKVLDIFRAGLVRVFPLPFIRQCCHTGFR